MVLLAIAAFSFHPNFDLTGGSTAASSESTVYSKELLKGLPAGSTEPTQVYLRSDSGGPLDTGVLAGYQSALSKVPDVGQVSAANLVPGQVGCVLPSHSFGGSRNPPLRSAWCEVRYAAPHIRRPRSAPRPWSAVSPPSTSTSKRP